MFSDSLGSFLLHYLNSRYSAEQKPKLHSVAWDIYWNAVSQKHPSSLLLAELFSLNFEELATDVNSPLPIMCRYYTMLHDLYRDPAQRMSDIQRFDVNAVMPFVEWLHRRYRTSPRARPVAMNGPLRIGYLCTWGLFTPDSPAPSILASLIAEQSKLQNRELFTYITVASSPDFLSAITSSTVRDYSDGYNFSNLEQLYEVICLDDLDILIADIPTATATYLFCRRAAPIQILLDIGAPFWSVPELDWVFTHNLNPSLNVSFDPSRQSSVFLAQSAVSPAPHTERSRALPPKGAPLLLGTFGRISKLSSEFVSTVRDLLDHLPHARYLALGNGSSPPFTRLLNDPKYSDRIQHFDQPAGVDASLNFGNIIHIFLDTFPLTGSHAIYRALSKGLPVVSRYSRDVDRLALSERDENLLSWNSKDYLSNVCRLARDHDFYRDCSERALLLAPVFNDTNRMLADFEAGMKEAIDYFAACNIIDPSR